MRAVLQMERGPNIIYTEIKPLLKSGIVHQITITKTYTQEGNSKQIANFTLADEWMVGELLIMLFGGYLAGIFSPEVTRAYKDNKLGEFYG